MALSLSISTILCFFINSWLAIWVLLEINTLSFCSLIQLNSNENNTKEITINYLIIQSIASALLIVSGLSLNESNTPQNFLLLLIIISLVVKTGGSPFHQWFINLSENISWLQNSILFTWQNLAPAYLILFQSNLNIIPFLAASAGVGAILIINNTILNEILAYSSVFNLSWIFLTISTGLNIFLAFTTLYWISLFFVVKIFFENNLYSMNEISNSSMDKNIFVLIFINLAGLPPLIGFLANWFSFSSVLSADVKLLPTSLLILSTVNLYVYLRIVNPVTLSNSHPQQNFYNNTAINTVTLFFITNLVILPTLLL